MKPEPLPSESESGFITADCFGGSQASCNGIDKWIETVADALLACPDPPLADSSAREGFDDIGCSFQGNEVLHMQVDGKTSQAGTILGRLFGLWRR